MIAYRKVKEPKQSKSPTSLLKLLQEEKRRISEYSDTRINPTGSTMAYRERKKTEADKRHKSTETLTR